MEEVPCDLDGQALAILHTNYKELAKVISSFLLKFVLRSRINHLRYSKVVICNQVQRQKYLYE